eukprot:6106141-Ditylum_brightwellii.AAC.1
MSNSPLSGLPRYGGGSEITLTLDLMVNNGALSSCVGNGSSRLLFSNLLDYVPKNKCAAGFVPAITIEGKGSARIVSFEKV